MSRHRCNPMDTDKRWISSVAINSSPGDNPPMLDDVLQTIDSRRHQSVSALTEFLSIPSISTKPQHAPDMRRAAQWLADQLSFGHLDVSVMPTGGHPAVV